MHHPSNPPSQMLLIFIPYLYLINTRKPAKFEVSTPLTSRVIITEKVVQNTPIEFGILYKSL